jgi:hypothetical protein
MVGLIKFELILETPLALVAATKPSWIALLILPVPCQQPLHTLEALI